MLNNNRGKTFLTLSHKSIAVIIPDKKAVETAVGTIFDVLFPVGDDLMSDNVKTYNDSLRLQLEDILDIITKENVKLASQLLDKLPSIKKVLIKDAEFILACDPAAHHMVEVISIYPGFHAIFCYRLANYLGTLGIPLLPRMITEYAHKTTGIDIHPMASIGIPFAIDHGTGIVIGETATIGNNVILYQGVTLGALSVEKNKASKKRHPTIEDNVVLYANCTILGGSTIVGRNSIIGGNVWLTESILPFTVVYHKSEIIVRNHDSFREPVNFII